MTNITKADGDPLRNSSGVELYALAINGVSIYKHEDNQVVFNSAGYQFGSVVIGADGTFTTMTGTQGLTTTDTNMNTGTNSLMGKFVGQDVEGPPGVIGTLDFAAASFEKGALRGSFGAERT